MGKLLRISRGGQLSVPAAVRKRWNTTTVVAEDHGDHLLVRPAPDDPIEAAAGAFAGLPGPSAEEVRRQERRDEAEIVGRRARPHR